MVARLCVRASSRSTHTGPSGPPANRSGRRRADLRRSLARPRRRQTLEAPVHGFAGQSRQRRRVERRSHRFNLSARPHLGWHDVSEPDLPEQFRIRQAKRERLLAEGRDPYPVSVPRTHTLAEIRAAYPDLAPDTADR